MTYTINNHNSRSLRIQNKIANAATEKSDSSKIDALTELLKIDTNKSNEEFLQTVRSLKQEHPFINDLCKRRASLAIFYAFKGENSRAERYKSIINQLKTGLYVKKNGENSCYFPKKDAFTQSVCEKIETIKNGYLEKTYTSTEDVDYQTDHIIFNELSTFNNNLEFKPSKAISLKIQGKNDDDDLFFLKKFTKANPDYLCVTEDKQNSTEVNIKGKPVQELKQEMFNKLGIKEALPEMVTDANTFNKFIGKAIRQQQVCLKIIAMRRGAFARRPEDKYSTAVRTMRDNENKILGYKFGSREVGKGLTLKNPIKECSKAEQSKGSFKTLTHADPGSVKFRLDNVKHINMLSNDKNNKDAIDAMKELPSFVQQYRINEKAMIAINLGTQDLNSLIFNSEYKFNLSHWYQAANDLDKFHIKGFRHRDLKPENMMLKDQKIYFIDHDFAGMPGEFKQFAGTPCWGNISRVDVVDNNDSVLSLKVEQQQFLHVMIMAKYPEAFNVIDFAARDKLARELDSAAVKNRIKYKAIEYACSYYKTHGDPVRNGKVEATDKFKKADQWLDKNTSRDDKEYSKEAVHAIYIKFMSYCRAYPQASNLKAKDYYNKMENSSKNTYVIEHFRFDFSSLYNRFVKECIAQEHQNDVLNFLNNPKDHDIKQLRPLLKE